MSKESRRKALKVMAVVAPTVWVKPVVDSVLLPAHAITSCDESGWLVGDFDGRSAFLGQTTTRCECEELAIATGDVSGSPIIGATWGALTGNNPGECHSQHSTGSCIVTDSSWVSKYFDGSPASGECP